MNNKLRAALQHLRGSEWLLVAGIIALGIALVLGGTAYLTAWAGTLGKAATGAWGGVFISRFTLQINTDEAYSELGQGLFNIARCLLVGLIVIAVCLAV